MFNRKSPAEKTGLEKALDDALMELHSFHADSEEYAKVMTHVDTLAKLVDQERDEKLSPNTMAMVLGNAAVTAMVVTYESKNVLTTKATAFWQKLR